MELLTANNATTTIAGSISDTATAVNLASGSGVKFPALGAGQYYVATFRDAATRLENEIVWVTAMTGDTATILRAQEGTTARAWLANDLFSNLWTAGQVSVMVQESEAQGQTFNYGVDVGSANAYQVALDPAVTTVIPGMPVTVKISNTNTGPSTFNNGSGAVSVRRRDGSALIGGEIVAGDLVTFRSDGTFWRLPGIAPATAAAITAGTDTQSAVTPAQLATISGIPTGVFMPFGGSAAPAGWLLCDGSSLLRTGTFAALFAVIGTTYGSADGTHFNVPDMRGRVAAGADAMGGTPAGRLGSGPTGGVTGSAVPGASGGEQAHAQTTTELASHTHTFNNNPVNASGGTGAGAQTGNTGGLFFSTMNSAGNGVAANVVQPTLVANYIIKI